jgi:magnesium-transporting ATPase (P-type)
MRSDVGTLTCLLSLYGGAGTASSSSSSSSPSPLPSRSLIGGSTFVGLLALVDPVRAGVPRGLALCLQHARMRVLLITPDGPEVAAALADKAGQADLHTLAHSTKSRAKG